MLASNAAIKAPIQTVATVYQCRLGFSLMSDDESLKSVPPSLTFKKLMFHLKIIYYRNHFYYNNL